MVTVTTTVAAQNSGDAQPSLSRWRGSWQRLPKAPIAARTDAATAAILDHSNQSRIFVWGGRGADGDLLSDGAIFDVRKQDWQILPPSPLAPRTDAIVRYDGDAAFIIWGGYDADGEWLDDGAGYEFRHRRWTMMPPSPLPATPGDFDGNLGGYVAIAADPEDGSPLVSTLLWDDEGPAEEYNDFGSRINAKWSWSAVQRPPLPVGERYEVVNEAGKVATLISYPSEGFASSVELEFATSDAGYSDEATLPITGDGASGHRTERFAWIGSGSPPDGDEPVTYGALSPVTRFGQKWRGMSKWRTTSPSPVTFDAASPLIVSPRHVIEADRLIAWDPTTARWLRIRPPDGGRRTGASAGWLQGQLLLWGGTTPDGIARGDGWVFRPRLGRRTVALPEQPIGISGCGEFPFVAKDQQLTGAIDDPRVTWFAGATDRGARIKWPPGYVARFSPRLEVIDPSGVVVARAGDGLRSTRDSVKMNELHVCPHHYFDVRGSTRMLRWVGNDGASTSRQQETAQSAASSPFERLWRPLDPTDIPFQYSCGLDLSFTTTDLATASRPSDVSASLASVVEETGPLISDREVDWYVVRQTDDRVLALAPMGRTVDDQFFDRTDEGWHFKAGGSPCTPRASFGDTSIGRWRLDPGFPAPGPKTRRLHVLGYLGCDGTERAGKARIHMTDDAALIAVPMRSTIGRHLGACLGPTRMTVTLPEPLGRRTLYDAGSLPVRGASEKLDIDRINSSGSGG